MKNQNTNTINRNELELELEVNVKIRITENLMKRLEGWEDIDDKYSKGLLINRWMAVIIALNNNDQDTNKTAWELYRNKSLPVFSFTSIEDARALIKLVEIRFLEEIWAYSIFLNECDELTEKEIMEKIEEPLSNISSGGLNL